MSKGAPALATIPLQASRTQQTVAAIHLEKKRVCLFILYRVISANIRKLFGLFVKSFSADRPDVTCVGGDAGMEMREQFRVGGSGEQPREIVAEAFSGPFQVGFLAGPVLRESQQRVGGIPNGVLFRLVETMPAYIPVQFVRDGFDVAAHRFVAECAEGRPGDNG